MKNPQTMRQVVHALEMKANASYAEIAACLNMSEQLVRYHWEKCIEDGTILGHNAIIDHPLVGHSFHLLYFSFFGLSGEAERAWLSSVNQLPRVAFIARTVGRWNATLGVVTRSHAELSEAITKICAKVSGKIAELVVTTEIECEYSSLSLLRKGKAKLFKSRIRQEQASMDELDYELTYLLARNCRSSSTELAQRLKIAPSTVSRRVARLEEQGVIICYRAHINYDKLGYQHFRLLFTLASLSPEIISAIRAEAVKSGCVESTSRYLGLADLDMRVRSKSLEELADFVGTLRTHFPSIIVKVEIVPLFSWRAINYFPGECDT